MFSRMRIFTFASKILLYAKCAEFLLSGALIIWHNVKISEVVSVPGFNIIIVFFFFYSTDISFIDMNLVMVTFASLECRMK